MISHSTRLTIRSDSPEPEVEDDIGAQLRGPHAELNQLAFNEVTLIKDERSALRWIAGAVGARSQVVYLPIDHEEQRRRVTNRFATTPDQTVHMSDVELEQWRAQFQEPADEELRGSQIPPVPPEHSTWSEWASHRWPSLPDQFAATTANSRYSHEP